MNNKYCLVSKSIEQFSFLDFFSTLLDGNEVEFFIEDIYCQFDRVSFDGLITFLGVVNGKTAGFFINDFRINGGSFGKAVSLRANHFIEYLKTNKLPSVFLLNTLGVRIVEGRTVFSSAFSLIPILTDYRKDNLLITISIGKTLGIGALIFGLGRYRMAISQITRLNLTGPEVVKLFFGKKFDFDKWSSAENQFERNSLINEIFPTRELALNKTRFLLNIYFKREIENELLENINFSNTNQKNKQQNYQVNNQQNNIKNVLKAQLPDHFWKDDEGEYIDEDFLSSSKENLSKILSHFESPTMELFPQLSPNVRTFIANISGTTVGLFISPPLHSNNLISFKTLRRYHLALDLFSDLKLPIISFLDTLGVDPRDMESESEIISELLVVSEKIIKYPYKKMGFTMNRCFGGASILGFPKIFGSKNVYALKGTKIGIMHDSLITQVLTGSPRLLEKWEKVNKTQSPDLSDMVAEGLIDEVISEVQLSEKLKNFISQ